MDYGEVDIVPFQAVLFLVAHAASGAILFNVPFDSVHPFLWLATLICVPFYLLLLFIGAPLLVVCQSGSILGMSNHSILSF